MDLKFRKLIARFKPLHKLCRAVMYNSGIFFYRKIYKDRNYRELFDGLKDSAKGKRCFIIGNGPSLTAEDLDKLAGEDCIGTNEIHKIFPKTVWRPKYYLVMDRYSKTTPEQIRSMEAETVFLGDYYWRFNKVLRKDAVCLHQHYNFDENKYRFSEDIGKGIVNSPTVSYGAMQIMAFLGYSEIYLLGFDHNYQFEFDANGKVIKNSGTQAHFFNDSAPDDIIANVLGMTRAYEAFERYTLKKGILVRNVTRGGNLEVFKRADLDDVLGTGKKENG